MLLIKDPNVAQSQCINVFTWLLNAVYPMHHTDFAHEFLRGDPMVRIELICHVRLGYRPNNINQVSNHAIQYMRHDIKKDSAYLFSRSEGVFIGHILNVIG